MSTSSLASTMVANAADSSPEMHRMTCPHCSKRLKIPVQYLKKSSLKCPKCTQSITLAAPRPTPAPPPIPASPPTTLNPRLAETLPHAKPPVLARTLPHNTIAPTALQPTPDEGLDYLSDYEPAGLGIRFLGACTDMFAFTMLGYALMAVWVVAILIALKFTTYGPFVSLDAYTSVGGFIVALLQTAWNILTSGSLTVWFDALILMIPYLGVLIGGGYALWYCSCKILTTRWQATMGKKMFGLIVVDESGHRVTRGQATARWFYRLLGLGFFCLGLSGIRTSPHQTWYDRMAKTQVLRRRKEEHA